MYRPQVVKRAAYWYKTDVRKQRFVRSVGQRFNLKTFVETGTYKGAMTAAARKVFDRVYSIELHRPFYEKAVERFEGDSGVTLLFGDSGEKMRELLEVLKEPCLFWLDAHGGAEAKQVDGTEAAAPLIKELAAILTHPLADQHVIMVDDVHVFERNDKWGAGVWPELEKLRDTWLAKHPDWVWKIQDDILLVHKKRSYG